MVERAKRSLSAVGCCRIHDTERVNYERLCNSYKIRLAESYRVHHATVTGGVLVII